MVDTTIPASGRTFVGDSKERGLPRLETLTMTIQCGPLTALRGTAISGARWTLALQGAGCQGVYSALKLHQVAGRRATLYDGERTSCEGGTAHDDPNGQVTFTTGIRDGIGRTRIFMMKVRGVHSKGVITTEARRSVLQRSVSNAVYDGELGIHAAGDEFSRHDEHYDAIYSGGADTAVSLNRGGETAMRVRFGESRRGAVRRMMADLR